MFVEEVRRAIAATPRAELCRLSGVIWKAFSSGAIGEDDAQSLAEAVEAKRKPVELPTPRRRVGSRPRAPESLERRRRWVAAGWLPPALAARFTLGEQAVMAVVAAETLRRGDCRLTVGHIALVIIISVDRVRLK